jgi:hypothetical protein
MSSILQLALAILTFTSSAVALGPAAVNLRTAGNYVILAESGISSVPNSVITGDMGISPAGASSITGFGLTLGPGGTYSTSTQVTGRVYAANYVSPTPTKLTTAILDMQAAYTDAAGRTNPNYLNLASGNLGGLTLTGGLYKWTTGVTIPSSVTINGSATDTWIFQVAGTLIESAGKSVTLIGGALAKNVVWAVAGATTIGAGAHFEGVLLDKTSITVETGASVKGRLLAQTAVVLQKATVTT